MPAPRLRLEEREPTTTPATTQNKLVNDALREHLPQSAMADESPDRELLPPVAAPLGPVDAQAVARALGGPLLSGDELRVPLPDLPAGARPWTVDDALRELRTAREGLGGLYDGAALESWVDAQLQDFLRRCTVDGIRTVSDQAVSEKRKQLHADVERLASEARGRWTTWRLAAGRLLTDAVGRAMTLPRHAELKSTSRLEELVARTADVMEEAHERDWLRHTTLARVLERYRQSDDARDRWLVRLCEAGDGLPPPLSDEDVHALDFLPRFVQARRLARVPPPLKDALAEFKALTDWRATSEAMLTDYVGAGLKR